MNWRLVLQLSLFGLAMGLATVHGLLVSIVKSVWITGSHVLLFDRYMANHPQEAVMMTSMPLPDFPRLMMAMMGPVIGVVSGLVLVLFAVVAGKLVRR